MNISKATGNVRAIAFGLTLALLPSSWAADWYEATGKPEHRALITSSDLRAEFSSIESDIADKLPTLTGNGGEFVRVNSGETALEAADFTYSTGSFAVDWETACTTTPSQTVTWVQIGRTVTATWDATRFSCSSDSTEFTAGVEVPAGLRPVDAAFFPTVGADNNVEVNACLRVNTDGTIDVWEGSGTPMCGSNGTWTASNTKGLALPGMSWVLP